MWVEPVLRVTNHHSTIRIRRQCLVVSLFGDFKLLSCMILIIEVIVNTCVSTIWGVSTIEVFYWSVVLFECFNSKPGCVWTSVPAGGNGYCSADTVAELNKANKPPTWQYLGSTTRDGGWCKLRVIACRTCGSFTPPAVIRLNHWNSHRSSSSSIRHPDWSQLLYTPAAGHSSPPPSSSVLKRLKGRYYMKGIY